MQILAVHFNRKKSQFINFFSQIIRIIDKLAYQIQLQIDNQYFQSVNQFQNVQTQHIKLACQKMDQNRIEIFQQMCDKLCITLKNFVNQIAFKTKNVPIKQEIYSQVKPQANSQLIFHKNQLNKTNSKTVSQFSVQPEKPQIIDKYQHQKHFYPQKQQNVTMRQNNFLNNKLQNNFIQIKQLHVKTQILSPPKFSNQKIQMSIKMPSPFSQKIKQRQLQQSRRKQSQRKKQNSPTQRSKKKIQILKRSDVCESLDNYLNKQARQMLQKSQAKPSYGLNSLKKSSNKKLDTPQRNELKLFENSSNIDKRIQQKLGSSNVNIYEKYNKRKESLISPIQIFKQQAY